MAIETGGGFLGGRFVNDLIQAFIADGKVSVVDLDDPDEVTLNEQPDVAVIRAPLVAGLRGWSDTVATRHRANKPTLVVLPPGVVGDALARESVPALLIDASSLLMTGSDVAAILTNNASELAIDDSADPELLTLTGDRIATPNETAGLAELIARVGDGWPAWVVACVAAMDDRAFDGGALARIGSPAFRRQIVLGHLTTFTDHDVALMAQLAHFETFTPQAAAAVGGLDFAETVLPHAPGLMRTRSGLFRFVAPVRSQLVASYPLTSDAAEVIAPVLAGDGEIIAAVDALIAAGLASAAASLLDNLPGPTLDQCNQRELLAVLRLVSAVVPERVGLGLKQARVHGNLAETLESVRACENVMAAAPQNSTVWLEAAVELMWHHHRTIDLDTAVARLAVLREAVSAGTAGPLVWTRLREIEANILGQSPDPRTVQRGLDMLTEVAAEWEHQREDLRASRALLWAATGPMHHLGQYRDAQAVMDRAASLAIGQTFDFGVAQVVKARFDALCADREAFRQSHNQASMVIEPTGIGWLKAHLHISAAVDASWNGDAPEIDRCFRTAKHLFGPSYDTDNGVMLNCVMAELLAVAGDIDAARRALDDVRHRASLNLTEFSIVEIIVAARAGAIDSATTLWAELDPTGTVPNDRRWRILLELENAALRPSPSIVAVISSEAERLGLSHLLPLLSSRLFVQDGEPLKEHHPRFQVLGGFAIDIGSHSVVLPGTKAGELVKLLVISGGSIAVETVIESLWPGVDVDVGTRRLRNIVRRAREPLGHGAITRSTDHHSLGLGPNSTSDLTDFNRATQESDANRTFSPARARDAAITALDLYKGPLLPDDIYSDYVNQKRIALAETATRLLGYLVQHHQPNPGWLAETRRRIATDPGYENDEAGGLN